MIRVGAQDVRVKDVVQLYGKLKTIVDMKAISRGTGKLLHLSDGSTYRLVGEETLPAQERS